VIIPEITPVEPSSFIEQMMMLAEANIIDDETNWAIIDIVSNEINHLAETDRMLLQLYFFEHKTYNEITEIMGYSSKSVAWYAMQKALACLQVKLLRHPEIKEKIGEVDGD
jgi:DNA-directed RNA polymerase specialized sigma subunit